MDVDLARLPTGTAAWLALVNHALTLGDLSEVDWLELKGRLHFTSRGDRKRSAVTLARALLGLANRSPETAARHLSGHGVILVGIEGRTVAGAEEVDGAVLGDALLPYVGDDGPRWDYLYVRHPDGLVLALVVDPPRWGDSIHACRKEYSAEDGGLTVRDGDVFVRVPGRTRLATSADLATLQARREGSAARGAQVTVEYGETFDHVDTTSVLAIVESEIDRTVDKLLAPVRTDAAADARFGSALGASLGALRGDERSSAAFRREVEQWRATARAHASQVTEDFYRYELARGHFSIRNESDRYLEAVRVQVHFPSGVRALAESDAQWCEHRHGFDVVKLLPETPRAWGTSSLYSLTWSLSRDVHRDLVQARERPFQVGDDGDGVIVTWLVGDLRPRSTEVGLAEKFAIVTDEHLTEVVIRWRVTARGVDHVFEGESTIRCAHSRITGASVGSLGLASALSRVQ